MGTNAEAVKEGYRMKRIKKVLAVCLLTLSAAACQSSPQTSPPQNDTSAQEETTVKGQSLVVYFSATGNTRSVAQTLAEMQDAELYEIIPSDPYSEGDLDYNDDNSRANREQGDENARPQITGTIENFASYDVVYVGFPIWWGTLPRILDTFFDTYDFSGKTIVPFCTSGGSGIDTALARIRELEPDADVKAGARIDVEEAQEQLSAWLEELSLRA